MVGSIAERAVCRADKRAVAAIRSRSRWRTGRRQPRTRSVGDAILSGLRRPARQIPNDDALLRAILAAFPDRLAKRRETNSPRAVMVGGRGVKLAPGSRVQQAELFLCLDVEGSGSEALVRVASAIERSWLPDEMLTIGTEVFFDEPSGRVQARRQVCWDDLILEESPAPLPDDDSVSRMLAEAATTHWDDVKPKDDSPAAQFLARVRCLREWLPELNLTAFDDAQLQSLLPSLCLGRRSLVDLRNAPWVETIQATLTPTQCQAVEREVPTHLTVPSGSRITLEYEPGRPPILAVRIQEIFGLRETPRVARGRVPVLLHLLAPNYRPQQVTDDLPSFWANAYPIIRGELRRRYPRPSVARRSADGNGGEEVIEPLCDSITSSPSDRSTSRCIRRRCSRTRRRGRRLPKPS